MWNQAVSFIDVPEANLKATQRYAMYNTKPTPKAQSHVCGPVQQLPSGAVGSHALIRSVDALTSSRAVVSDAVEPRGFPAQVCSVQTSLVVAEVRADPFGGLLQLVEILAVSLGNLPECFWEGRWVAVWNSDSGSEHGDLVD